MGTSRSSPPVSSSEPPPQSLGFGCPEGIGAFRFSDIYGRCEITVPEPIPEPDIDGPRRGQPRGPSLEEVRRSVIDRAIALASSPDIRIAPGRVGLTGLPSFFWLGSEPQPVSATAGVRGVSVTAVATPSSYEWSFGDGRDLVTSDPGRAWSRHQGGSIEHTYEATDRYDVEATILWTASWSMNGGAPQALGSFTTSDSVEYPVREVIAFLTSR